MLGPRTTRIAGTRVVAASTAITVTTVPPIPIERSIMNSNIVSDDSPIITARPEKSTARPAVAMVTATASSGPSPRASSSRKRLTKNSE